MPRRSSFSKVRTPQLLSPNASASSSVPHRPTSAAAARSSGSASVAPLASPRRRPIETRGARRAPPRGSAAARRRRLLGERGGEDHRLRHAGAMRAAQRAATPLMKPSTTAATPSRAASMYAPPWPPARSRRAAAAPRAPRAPSRPTAPSGQLRRGAPHAARTVATLCSRPASRSCRAAARGRVGARECAEQRRGDRGVAYAHLADGDHLGAARRDLVGDAVRPSLERALERAFVHRRAAS